MTQQYFLKIDQVEGESKIRGHEKEIEILSWNWTIGNVPSSSSSIGSGSGASAAKPPVSNITFSHYVDLASPNIMRLCLRGTHSKIGKLSVRSDPNSTFDYFTLTFENLIFTSAFLSATDGYSRPIETFTMAFNKVTEEYTKMKSDGSPEAKLSTSYDISTAKIT